jgi:pyruvate formate lyase activating enzyme
MRSVEMLKTGKVPCEFRTTAVPEFVTAEDVVCIGELVKGAKTHAFQQFVPQNTLDKRFENVKPYASEIIAGFAEAMQKFTENTLLRV